MAKPTYTGFGYLVIASAFGSTSANADEYFDWLVDRPETILSRGYRSQAEINADIYGASNRVNPPVYDSAIQGARWTLPSGVASIAIQDQMRPSFPAISTGNVLFVWEARWDSGFAGERGGLDTHKAFQLAKAGGGDERRIEIRTRFSLAPSGSVAQIDARGYIWDPAGQPLAGQVGNFTVEPNTWTRFWAFVDFTGRTFSFWVADDDTPPVRLFNRLQYSNMSGGLDTFWFEFNSSQTRSGSTLHVWARDFAVLRNVSNVDAIVAQGELEAQATPMAPSSLTAN